MRDLWEHSADGVCWGLRISALSVQWMGQ